MNIKQITEVIYEMYQESQKRADRYHAKNIKNNEAQYIIAATEMETLRKVSLLLGRYSPITTDQKLDQIIEMLKEKKQEEPS